MSRWLCGGGSSGKKAGAAKNKKKVPAVLGECDCSHMGLADLPKEAWAHRGTIRMLNMNSNAIKDIPKVSRELAMDVSMSAGCRFSSR